MTLQSPKTSTPRSPADGLLTPARLVERWPLARHLEQASGAPFCRLLSVAVDAAVERSIARWGGRPDDVCILALGGYGRFELSPRSDVDVLVFGNEVDDDRTAKMLEGLFDELRAAGLRPSVGHRTLDDTLDLASGDAKTAVSLLDTRLLAGSPELYGELRVRVRDKIFRRRADSIVRFLRREADLRRERLRSHWYLLEPNLKLSDGGLRDVHSVRWIRQILELGGHEISNATGRTTVAVQSSGPETEFRVIDSVVHLRDDHEFLLWVRNALHVMARWHQDQLTFEHQDQLIVELGSIQQAPYRFARAEDLMRAYHLHARRVARALRLWLARAEEALHRGSGARPPDRAVPADPGVVIRDGRLAISDDVGDDAVDTAALRLYRAMARTGLPAHHTVHERLGSRSERPDVKVLQDPEARRALLELVCGPDQGGRALERCHDAGVLARVLPEFEPLTGCFQRNIYHLYTVDVHSLRAVAALKDIGLGRIPRAQLAQQLLRGGYAGDVAVHVAALFHDLEKSTHGDQELTAAILEKAMRRLEVDPVVAEEVHFLVRHHLRLAVACQKMDLSDDHALLGLAREIASLERLDRLYLVTQGDMRAVNPDQISSWQFRLLDTLYLRLRSILRGGLDLWRDEGAVVERRIEQVVRVLTGKLPASSHPVFETVRRHYERLPTRYAVHASAHDVPLHISLLKTAARRDGDAAVSIRSVGADARPAGDRAGSELTEVVVAGCDRPHLLSALTGAFAELRVSIQEAHIFCTLDGNALDVFVVAGDQSDAVRERLEARLVEAAKDPVAYDARLPGRTSRGIDQRGPVSSPRVTMDESVSSRCLAVEVYGPDRMGLLHDLTHALTALELDIHLARVSTEGPMARDTFLVTELDGSQPESGPRWREIERHLVAVSAETGAD